MGSDERVVCLDGIPKDASIDCIGDSAVLELEDGTSSTTISIDKSSQSILPRRNALMVGRQVASCDIRIAHKSLSREHALLYYHSNNLYIYGLKTKAGTFVNSNNPIPNETPIELKDGDTIRFGKMKQLFRVKWKRDNGETNGKESIISSKEKGNSVANGDNATKSAIVQDNNPESKTKVGDDDNGDNPSRTTPTTREDRQKEIDAMVASLDQAPTYTKYNAPTSGVEFLQQQKSGSIQRNDDDDDDDAEQQQQLTTTNNTNNAKHTNKQQQYLEKYSLPFAESTNLHLIVDAGFNKNHHSAAIMDPTGARFAIGSTDSSLKLYDFAGMNAFSPHPFRNFIVDDGYPIKSLSYSPDGTSILVGTGSTQPLVFDRDGHETIKFVRGDVYVKDPSKTIGHTAPITCVRWHPLESNIVFSTSRDGSLRKWNVKSGKLSFGMLQCSDVLVIKNLQTGRRTVPSCLATTPSTIAIGTDCGSLQIYKYPFVSKLRPQQSVQIVTYSDNKKQDHDTSIASLVYSYDASKIAVRTKTTVTVWDTRKISKTADPIATYHLQLHDDDIGADSSTPTMAFSPDSRVICVATNEKVDGDNATNNRRYRSSLQVFVLSGKKKHKSPILSFPITRDDAEDQNIGAIVGLSWHVRLNQLLVTTQKGFQIVYSADFSKKGVLLSSGRGHANLSTNTKRKHKNAEDSLQEIYAARAPPPGTMVRSHDQIVAPNSLPLFSDKPRKGKKQRREEEFAETVAQKIPHQPAKGVYETGVNMFTQMIMDNNSNKAQIAGMDPREALAKYSEGKSYISHAYEGNVERILTDKTMEQEQEENEKKK